MKTHGETLAYRLARHENLVPAGFDPDPVSPFCHAGDQRSPLRSLSGPRVLSLATPRTNLVSVFEGLLRQGADLWGEVEGELIRLEASADHVRLAAKARWVLGELAERHPGQVRQRLRLTR